jgi:protein piccolo
LHVIVDGVGLKVVGGKTLPNGTLGAIVTQVHRPAMVETMGQVREGDQILEWNGISLSARTYEDVQRIIAESSGEVEVVVKR